MDLELLRQHVESGVVKEQRHPRLPLSIFNYADRCQYDRLWDDVSLQCRGLVMHGDRIVARPFRKFFNDTEHAPGEIPWHLPSTVTEKLDGSLGIVFYFGGAWNWCTRGSFVSEQAERGAEIYMRKYGHVELNPSMTYLFEIIYPANRIVVDYGDREDVVLLAMIHTASGIEHPLSESPEGLTVVRQLPASADAQQLRSIIKDDEEGYVIRFDGGFRVKVKGQRYMELHRLVSGVSSRAVWEALSSGKSLDELLAVIPDEFADWVRSEIEVLTVCYAVFAERVRDAAQQASKLPTRKEQAQFILANYKDVSGAVFNTLDGKDASSVIWKLIYPAFRRPQRLSEVEV